jgi:hypothetical protein
MRDGSDISLFVSLAGVMATALTAAIALGLLAPHRSKFQLGASALTLCASVLGVLAALIAVGKGRSETVLTWLMFTGVIAPAAYVLWATLHRRLELPGWATTGALVAVGLVGGALLLATSPEIWGSLGLRDIEAQRRQAERSASQAWPPDRTVYECDSQRVCPGPEWPTFNAHTNSAYGGDERYFVTASLVPRTLLSSSSTASTQTVNVLEVE